jgi:glyoxylase-like metal-dependent hydrolase (beta-lactamase superfamily II)
MNHLLTATLPLALLSSGPSITRTDLSAGPGHPAPKLALEEIGSDSTAFHVVATLITGPTEAILWDAQYHKRDAIRLADRIAASGKKLKAIVLSHPDHDHFMGAAIVTERFPGVPVYLTPAGLAEYQRTAADAFRSEKGGPFAAEAPDSIVTPRALPAGPLTVDGVPIEVIPDLQGDVLAPTNAILWIPSLKAALVADVAFLKVHPWLGASSEASRAAWIKSIERIRALHPAIVVAGHKRDVTAPDSPAVLDFMQAYLTDFDALRKTSADGKQLAAAMEAKYPDVGVAMLLRYGARMAFAPARPSSGAGASGSQGAH